MVDKDYIRLKHMLDSTLAILGFVKGKRRASLDRSRLLSSAIIREFEILGEAASQITRKTQDRFPELPWKQLIGMRNRLIHAYFDVNHDIIWVTIKDYLPSLKDALEQVVADWEVK